MTQITLESLGLDAEQLRELVVARAAMMVVECPDAEGTLLIKRLESLVRTHTDERIAALAEVHVLPNVSEFIENVTLQATNEWGEKTAEPLTFVEFLVERAHAYLTEKVNYEGKSKPKHDAYSWKASQTRIVHLVHQHLQYSIKTAMEEALKTANSQIIEGIQEAVKMKLAEVAAKLKITVKT